MDDLDLHLALEALRTNPAAHAYHERITRGMETIAEGTLTPFERDALHRLLARFPVSTPPSPDPVAALIAAFQDKLPQHDPAAVATAIQHALAQRPATLNGAPVTITMDGDTHAHQANLAIGNQVGGNLVQVTVAIPIPDARFDALLASALRTHEHEKTLARIQHAAQQIESDRLLNLRLKGFVGRVTEIAAIRANIEAMRPTGGYVLIKAAAGEGKSSSIAKLIQAAGIDQTPHHFIALTTGREYQLGLLRAVVAQLILKHNLTVSYFPEESYPAMKAEFARILDELAKQGIAETIYLDGLDQLQPEIDGSRDLSFLPPQPPPGIVMVLGSRPDETLKPLEILHRVDYDLPPLNEDDALALWYSVQPGVADGLLHDLYTALKGNALFVHLAADTMRDQSIADATSLIRQIEQNPNNLFGITLERIKGRSMSDWRSIWKPMLVLLLVAQEPLRLDVLGDLLGHDHDTMQDAVWVLGGLVSHGIDQRVALHHLLFRDYLAASVFNAREVKHWHQELANWCAKDMDTIWADDRDPIEHARRVYARHHYVTHLALAENWTTLWQVLDAGDYGEHKTRFDPSTRLYALDLDRGRESAITAGKSVDEHIHNLPRLWKYSLLRANLAERVDRWPDDLFIVLAMLDRVQEALERIELCSEPERQIRLWFRIIKWCDRWQNTIVMSRIQQMATQLLGLRTYNIFLSIVQTAVTLGEPGQTRQLLNQAITFVPTIDDSWKRASVLITIAQTAVTLGELDQTRQLLDQAITLAVTIDDSWKRSETLAEIAQAMATLGDSDQAKNLLDQAITLVATIDDYQDRSFALKTITHTAVTLGNIEDIRLFLNQAIILAVTIDDSWKRSETLAEIAQAMATLGDSDQAKNLLDQAITLVVTIDDSGSRAAALITITQAIATLGNVDHKHQFLNQAITLAATIAHCQDRSETLSAIVKTITTLGDINYAITLAATIDDVGYRTATLAMIAQTITIMFGNRDHAKELLDYAITLAATIDDPWERAIELRMITQEAAALGNIDYTQQVFDQVITLTQLMNDDFSQTIVLTTIAQEVATLGNIDYAQQVLDQVMSLTKLTKGDFNQANTLTGIAMATATLGNINQAKNLLDRAIKFAATIDDYQARSDALKTITHAAVTLGNTEDVQLFLNQVTTIATTIDHDEYRSVALARIAQAMATLGNSDQARNLLDQAITLAVTIDDSWKRSETLAEIAQAMATLGNSDQARNLLDQAITLATTIDYGGYRAAALIGIVQAIATLDNSDEARNLLDQAITLVIIINDSEYCAVALEGIVQVIATIDDSDQARNLLDQAITLATTIDDGEYRSVALARIAQAMATLGNSDEAKNLLDQAITLATTIDDGEYRSVTLVRIAQAMATLGNSDQALTMIQSINKPHERILALIDIIQTVKAVMKVIAIIHKEWSLCTTPWTTWDCLGLIKPLLKDNPQLVSQILESEAWVNDQLKRLG